MLQDGKFFLVRYKLNAVFSKYCDLFDLLLRMVFKIVG